MSRTLQIFAVSSVTLLMLAACNEPGTSAKNETSPAAQTLPHSPVTKTESSPAAAATGVLATVNGTPITTSRVDELVKSFTSQNPGQSADAETRKVILEQLIMQTVIAQDAVQKGLDKKPEIAEKLELTRQSMLASALIQDYLTSHRSATMPSVPNTTKPRPALPAPNTRHATSSSTRKIPPRHSSPSSRPIPLPLPHWPRPTPKTPAPRTKEAIWAGSIRTSWCRSLLRPSASCKRAR